MHLLTSQSELFTNMLSFMFNLILVLSAFKEPVNQDTGSHIESCFEHSTSCIACGPCYGHTETSTIHSTKA